MEDKKYQTNLDISFHLKPCLQFKMIVLPLLRRAKFNKLRGACLSKYGISPDSESSKLCNAISQVVYKGIKYIA